MIRTTSTLPLAGLLTAAAIAVLSCAGLPSDPVTESGGNPETLADLVSAGKTDEVRRRFTGSESVNQKNPQGQSLLHIAALRNDADMVSFLLSLKADPSIADASGDTPMAAAAAAGCLDAATALAKAGAPLFAANASGKTAWDLAYAAGKGAIDAVAQTATVAQKDSSGRTALHLSVLALDEGATATVLSRGGAVSARDAEGKSPLSLAYGRPESVAAARIAASLLLAGAEPERESFAYFETAVLKRNVAMRFAEGKTALHIAAENGQLGFVRYLLDRSAPVNAKDISSSTPLHGAVREGYLECARVLLDAGADPNQQDSSGNTPLHLVMPVASRSAIFGALLAAGANPNMKDSYGETPLHIAARLGMDGDILQALVSAGADVNERNKKGVTPLALAIERGQASQATAFVALGADIHAEDMEGISAVRKAIDAGLDMVRAVIVQSNIQSRDSRGRTPLHVAVEASAIPDIITYLMSARADVNARDRNGDTPLHVAVRGNDRATGELLLARGADVFTPNVSGESALKAALTRMGGRQDWVLNSNVIKASDGAGNTPLHLAAEWQLTSMVSFIADKGGDLNARNANGETPLFNAVKADSAETVLALLRGTGDKKADLNARDFLGNTALHACVRWASPNAARAIVDQDARFNGRRALNARNLAGNTALHEAALAGNLSFARFLLDAGTDVNAVDETGKTALTDAIEYSRTDVIRLLLGAGASPVMQDMYGRNAFHAAVEYGAPEVISLIRNAGGNAMSRDSFGNTPLSLAFRKDADAVMATLGGNRNVVDSDGNTPLHVAVASKASPAGPSAIVKALIDAGYPVNNRNGSGATALLLAVRSGETEAARVLLAAGADPYASDNSGESAVSYVLVSLPAFIPTLAEFAADRSDAIGDGLLHYAARMGNAETVKRLLTLPRIDRNAKNVAGETARDVAVRWQRNDIADLLK